MQRVGSRAQVMHGNAKMTGGGLKKKDLKYNKQGKIVSKKMSTRAKKEKRLQKAGYTTKKGQFGAIRSMMGGETKEMNKIIEEYITKLNGDMEGKDFNPDVASRRIRWGDSNVGISLSYDTTNIIVTDIDRDDESDNFVSESIIPHLIETYKYDNISEISIREIPNDKKLLSILKGIVSKKNKDNLKLTIIGGIDGEFNVMPLDFNTLSTVAKNSDGDGVKITTTTSKTYIIDTRMSCTLQIHKK